MIRSRAALLIAGTLGLVGAGLGFVYWYDRTGQRPDLRFDTSVARPAYASHAGPRIAFDVAHRNWHTPSGRYRPLADLLRSDGYVVVEEPSPFSAASLEPIRLLVIANAMGPDGHEGRAAFEPAEEAALVRWVRGGGALLLVADHVPFGSAAQRLSERLGVTMFLAFARDDTQHSGWDKERLVFSRDNGLLTSGPIADGVDRVVTFTGQSLSVPPGATAVLRMGESAYDWQSRSVRHPARGHAQAVALRLGAGKVVVLGEAGLLTAQVDPLGFKMGMNAAGNDDRQFALNVFHWLSGMLSGPAGRVDSANPR